MNAKPVSEWTDSELQRWIAEQLGWTDFMFNADGTLLGHHPDYPHKYDSGEVPNWSGDTRWAIELLKQMSDASFYWDDMFQKWACNPDIYAKCVFDLAKHGLGYIQLHTNPARAICEAYAAICLAREYEEREA